METKNISKTQKELVKNWRGGFRAYNHTKGIKYFYEDGISVEAYCAFIGLDYKTLQRLGDITYSIVYRCVDSKYILTCETYIDNCMNGRLSTEYEDTEDYLGFYQETTHSSNK